MSVSRWYIIVALLLIGASSEALADIVGSLRARVVDASEKPLPGAIVRILGTPRGGVTKEDGVALIRNLPVGPQRVRVTCFGKDTAIMKVTVVADQTADISVTMMDKSNNGSIIEVTATREMVMAARIGSGTVVDESAHTSVALSDVKALVGRQTGVLICNGIQIRTCRRIESQVMVDGLTVTEPFTGGLGNTGATVPAALPSTNATAQVDVQIGGMSAEDGIALGDCPVVTSGYLYTMPTSELNDVNSVDSELASRIEAGVRVAPNPAADVATVSVDAVTHGTIRVSLVSSMGEILATTTYQAMANASMTTSLPVASVAAGTYYVMVEQAGARVTRPLSVVR